MFRRFGPVAIISVALAVVLSACGDSGEPEPAAAIVAPSPGAPSVAAVATAEPAAPTTETPRPPARREGAAPRAEVAFQTEAAQELTAVEVVKRLTPSVVHIGTETVPMGMFNEPVPSGVGTGVVLDDRGNILTNNHVVEGAERIVVTLSTGESFVAQLVGRDPGTDTAVVRIDAQGLQPAKLGISGDAQVGEDVIAIGHALGLAGGPTVSKGVVSALGRSINTDAQVTLVDLIQTDASINPGNSGGPLVNLRAEVIGINTAIRAGSQGIGFAINIDDAKPVAAHLIENGFVRRGYLGIGPVNLTPAIASQLQLQVTEGILVWAVGETTAAGRMGLRQGDVIVQLGDEPIVNTGQLSKFLLEHPPGETVEVVFIRGTQTISGTLTLQEKLREAR